MRSDRRFGYLLVHFVESASADGEQIYFSLSDRGDPRHWTRLNGGRPVLRSLLGTGGVRDPHLVRSPEDGTFFLIATDLSAHASGWDAATRSGSRAIEIWQSSDLVEWGEQRHVVIAPPSAGMAWAPEAVWDEERAAFLVHWTSSLYDTADHSDPSHSLIMRAYTNDFIDFTAPEVWLDPAIDPSLNGDVLDATVIALGDRCLRFVKGTVEGVADDEGRPVADIYVESAPGLSTPQEQWTRVASGITYRATHRHRFEGPLVFRANDDSGWYLWADHFGDAEQGYVPFFTTDIAQDAWSPVPQADYSLPPNTKHGVVLPLLGDEWERVRARYA